MNFSLSKLKKALLVLAECTNALDLSSVQGMDLCFNGWKWKKKRNSWRDVVFFQSAGVAVKFRAWIFNQNGFPVKDFRLLSLHNKDNPRHRTIHNELLRAFVGIFGRFCRLIKKTVHILRHYRSLKAPSVRTYRCAEPQHYEGGSSKNEPIKMEVMKMHVN